MSSGTLIENFAFGGVLIDILADDPAALPEVIWLKVEGIYEAFELLREGRQKTPRPQPDLFNPPDRCVQEEKEDAIALQFSRAVTQAQANIPSSS